MLRKSILAAGVCAVAAGALLMSNSVVQTSHASDLLVADAHEMAAVKQRQQTMKDVGGNMKIIAEFVKASKGTAAEASAAAAKIGELATSIPEIFEVKATLEEMDTVGKNRSKPEIWSDWDGFLERGKVLEDEAAKMAAVLNSGDAGTIQAQFATFGKEGCGGCHTTYRGPET